MRQVKALRALQIQQLVHYKVTSSAAACHMTYPARPRCPALDQWAVRSIWKGVGSARPGSRVQVLRAAALPSVNRCLDVSRRMRLSISSGKTKKELFCGVFWLEPRVGCVTPRLASRCPGFAAVWRTDRRVFSSCKACDKREEAVRRVHGCNRELGRGKTGDLLWFHVGCGCDRSAGTCCWIFSCWMADTHRRGWWWMTAELSSLQLSEWLVSLVKTRTHGGAVLIVRGVEWGLTLVKQHRVDRFRRGHRRTYNADYPLTVCLCVITHLPEVEIRLAGLYEYLFLFYCLKKGDIAFICGPNPHMCTSCPWICTDWRQQQGQPWRTTPFK